MLTRDPLFDIAIRSGSPVVSSCDVLKQGLPVVTGIPVLGTVNMDRGQFCRRSCTVTIPDAAYIPYLATDPLQPWGNEIRLWRGVLLPDNRVYSVPVGTFVIWSAEVDDPFEGVKITGYDRCKLIQQARFLYPRVTSDGMLINRLRTLASEAVPWADFVSNGVGDSHSGAVTYDEQRDQAASDIATALGAEFYSDAWGVLTVSPVPDPGGPIAWEIDASDVMVGAARTASRDSVYNAVKATSSTTGVQDAPSAVATDDDPWSPTYFGGQSRLTGAAFGQAPYFFDSPLLTTAEQCMTAARAILRDVIGLQQSVSVTTAVQPALEPGDVLGLRFPDGTTAAHLAESWSLDLSAASSMQIETRTTNYQLASR